MTGREAIVALVALLAGIGCSEEKAPLESDPPPDYELVATQSIGPAGGALTTDAVRLEVPAGAFAGDEILLLYEATGEPWFGEHQLTGTFRIEGIPTAFERPIVVKLQPSTAGMSDPIVAVRDEYAGDGEEDRLFFDLLAATEAGGFLVVELPARPAPPPIASPRSLDEAENWLTAIVCLGAWGYRTMGSPQEHFWISYPYYAFDVVREVATYLDAAYDSCSAMGFDYDITSNWPMVVEAYMDPDRGPYSSTAALYHHAHGKDEFWINEYMLTTANLVPLRRQIGREFVDFVLCLHHPLYPYPQYVTDDSSLLDWDYAIELWAEKMFLDDPDWVPTEFRAPWLCGDCQIAIFRGLAYLDRANATHWDEHVRGLPVFVEYLTSVYGSRTLGRMYREIEMFEPPVAALIEVLDDYPNVWWPGFFRRYVAGEFYQVGTEPFLNTANLSGTFDTSVDRHEVFLGRYQDFSAKLYRVVLGDTDVAPDARLEFLIESADVPNEDDLKILLFTLKDGALEFLTEGTDFALADTPQLHADDADLLAVVVNSAYTAPEFTSESDLEFTIRYLEPDQDYCSITAGVTGHFADADGATYDGFLGYTWASRGTLTGNLYEGSPESGVHGDVAVGTLSVLLGPGASAVASFSADFVMDYPWSGSTYTYRIGGHDVPFAEFFTNPPGTLYEVEGSACAASVESYHYMHEQSDGWWQGFTTFHCDESSYVEIRLVTGGRERVFSTR